VCLVGVVVKIPVDGYAGSPRPLGVFRWDCVSRSVDIGPLKVK
jgi:hypothetical protein